MRVYLIIVGLFESTDAKSVVCCCSFPRIGHARISNLGVRPASGVRIRGAVLTVFGAVLLGMPVWRTIDVSIDQKGFSAKFEQLQTEIIEVRRDAEAKISRVETSTDEQISQVRRRTEALEQYEAIQTFYGKHKSENSCSEYRNIVESIRVFVGSKNLVPESFQYSIRYPSQKAMPTISDLAIDRITRIQGVRSQCFQ